MKIRLPSIMVTNSKTILFVHSAGLQTSQEGSTRLVQQLKQCLSDDYRILMPEMPEPENPRYGDWKQKLDEEFLKLSDPVTIIGHSLGASVVLKYLSENLIFQRVEALYLIATPFWGIENWEIEEFILADHFADQIKKIRAVHFYHSILDKWVPYNHMKQYALLLPEATYNSIDGEQHDFTDGLPALALDILNPEKDGRSFQN